MTDAAQPAAPPALDPNEMMLPPAMPRSAWANIVKSLDMVRRNVEHDDAKAIMALIDKIVTGLVPIVGATTVSNTVPAQSYRHARRAKGAKA